MLPGILLLIQFVFLSQLGNCSCGRILFVAGTGTKSHIYYFEGIIEALITNKHEVTFISHYKASLENANLTNVILPKNTKRLLVPNEFESNNLKLTILFLRYAPENCVLEALKDPGVQEILKKDFDLMLISTFHTDCFLSVAYNKSIPFIYVSYIPLMDPYGNMIGNPEFPSVAPHKLLPYVHPLSFTERVISVISRTFWNFAIDYFLIDRMEILCREHYLCSVDMPSFRTVGRTSSLTIVNSVRNLEAPIRPATPNLVYVGGIHIKSTKPLPKELEDWAIQSGDAGVIYFSLGSAVQPTNMKEEHFRIFIKVFATLKQKVIWKYDAEEIKNLPHNIIMSKWFPQQDILAHPKTRLFITHGGLLSMQEATYFGVPVIGMPVLGDQMNNVAEAVIGGWAILLNWDSFTEDDLLSAIHNFLDDDSYHRAVLQRSRIMRDQPLSNAQTVNYWINYVLRHEGAKHLQSPFLNMTWIQIYNFDVWMLVTIFTICIFLFIIYVYKRVFKTLFNNFKRKRD